MHTRHLLTWAVIGTLLFGCSAPPSPPAPTAPAATRAAAPPPTSAPTPSPAQAATPATASVSITGRWLGGFMQADGSAISLVVDFSAQGGATITREPYARAWPLGSVEQAGAEVRFAAAGDAGGPLRPLRFRGDLDADALALVGEITWDGAPHDVRFVALADSPAASDDLAGLYRFASGHAISLLPAQPLTIGERSFYAPGLTFTDLETGARRGLYALRATSSAGGTLLALGATRAVGYPLGARIEIQPNQAAAGVRLIWRSPEAAPGLAAADGESAERVALPAEDVRYTSADGTPLVGRLTLPPGPGPHPAFVMLHGSERGRRDGLGQLLLAHALASRGVALLSYDKRGVGDSGGTYRESADTKNLTLLAQDALAGVGYLHTRDAIDPAQIGLIGSSQAGWIIPIAAASDDVAFFVIFSGPVLSVGEESLYSSYANDGEAPPSLSRAAIAERLAATPPSGFDPLPLLADIDQPGLWLWGGRDLSVPTAESAANLERLIAAGKDNFSYVMFPDADHSMAISQSGLLADVPSSPGLVYYAALSAWLDQHVRRAQPPSVEAVTFPTEDGAMVSGEISGSGETAVIFATMGDCATGWPAVAQSAAAQGLLALTYQWRGCASDPGNEALLKQFVADARAAMRFARERGATRLILVGASLGGCASATLADETDVIGLVVVASPDAIPQWGFQVDAAGVATDIPKLFITAEDDSVVPITATRALYDLAAEPKEWQTYPGTAHGTGLLTTPAGAAFQERILAFLQAAAGGSR